jgi:integrase
MARPKKTIKSKEPVRIRFKELTNGNKSIYLDIYRDGKRTYEFLKLYIVPELDPASKVLNEHNLALANKVKADRIIELTNNEKGVTNTMLRSRMKLTDLFDIYEKYMVENGKSSICHSLKSLKKAIVKFRGDGITIRQVDKDYCINFIKFLRNDCMTSKGRHISLTTGAGYSTVLCTCLNWAVRNDYIRENPFDKIAPADRIKKSESTRQFLTIDELKKMIATKCPTREDVKQAFLFSCYCGLRYSDVTSLTWGDIKHDGDQWRVAIVMEKTEDPIYLPLSRHAMKWLPERGEAKDDSKVFSLPSVTRISLILKAWANAANVDKTVTYHVSRHTFATMMLTLDVDLYTTSKLLGHKDVSTTQLYAKIIDKKKDDAVNRVNNIFED